MGVPTKFLFSLVGVGLLTAGIIDYFTNFEENGCEMTWMYQWPEYLVSIPTCSFCKFINLLERFSTASLHCIDRP